VRARRCELALRVGRDALDYPDEPRLASAGEARALEFPWWMLRYQHTEAIRAKLAQGNAPATANKVLSAMKGVLKYSWRLGLMSADESDRASDVEPVRGTSLPPGQSIPRGELRSLFEACAAEANGPRMRARGVRAAAMLALLYVGGLRRTELASLRLSDYDPETRTLRIRGKGNKEREVYAEGGADLLLARWLELRGEGEPEDPLFLPVRKDGAVMHADPHGEKKSSLSDQAVYKMVKRRQREANVKGISSHDFRKTFVGDLLDAIGDLSTVQKLAAFGSRGNRPLRQTRRESHAGGRQPPARPPLRRLAAENHPAPPRKRHRGAQRPISREQNRIVCLLVAEPDRRTSRSPHVLVSSGATPHRPLNGVRRGVGASGGRFWGGTVNRSTTMGVTMGCNATPEAGPECLGGVPLVRPGFAPNESPPATVGMGSVRRAGDKPLHVSLGSG
jgi:site-specific recombinase XerD